MAYINHFGRKTANNHFGTLRYEWGANLAKVRGLRKLHGRNWRKQFPPGLLAQPLWGKVFASETYTAHQLDVAEAPSDVSAEPEQAIR